MLALNCGQVWSLLTKTMPAHFYSILHSLIHCKVWQCTNLPCCGGVNSTYLSWLAWNGSSGVGSNYPVNALAKTTHYCWPDFSFAWEAVKYYGTEIPHVRVDADCCKHGKSRMEIRRKMPFAFFHMRKLLIQAGLWTLSGCSSEVMGLHFFSHWGA